MESKHKEIEEFYISEDQLADVKRIAENRIRNRWPVSDPRSSQYRRVLERPQINWLRFIVISLGLSLSTIVLLFLLRMLYVSNLIRYVIAVAYMIVFCLIHKHSIICEIIRIYQHYAPDQVRMRCCCEPSCSVYMIMSIQKYGAVKGIIRGIKRLHRCNPRTGGIDYP